MKIEDKKRFFAQYYSQRVLWIEGGDEEIMPLSHWNSVQTTEHFNVCSLFLKPLSDITDEDYPELMMKKYPYQPFRAFKKGDMLPELFTQEQTDYLRSKGYALPWMGLSVDEMVQAGWIKLKGGK